MESPPYNITPESGEQAATKALEKLRQAVLARGIDEEKIARKLDEELEAEETKFFQHNGEVIEQHDVIAWRIRQEARRDAQRILAPEGILNGDLPVLVVRCRRKEAAE